MNAQTFVRQNFKSDLLTFIDRMGGKVNVNRSSGREYP